MVLDPLYIPVAVLVDFSSGCFSSLEILVSMIKSYRSMLAKTFFQGACHWTVLMRLVHQVCLLWKCFSSILTGQSFKEHAI